MMRLPISKEAVLRDDIRTTQKISYEFQTSPKPERWKHDWISYALTPTVHAGEM